MRKDTGDRHAPAGPTPEPFEVFYLREYPKVVGLLHGLLGSRLVAEELAQETFLVAYRDWDRISRLDNPRAWVRKVAINQRGSFLRTYLRQQTRERHAVVRYEDDRIKLADDHEEVWQAIRTLPPLQAQVIALPYFEDYSVAQVAAALGRAPCTRTMLGSAVMSGLLPGPRAVLLGSTCAYLVESRILTGQPANSRTRRPHQPRNAGPSLPANPRSGLLSSRLGWPGARRSRSSAAVAGGSLGGRHGTSFHPGLGGVEGRTRAGTTNEPEPRKPGGQANSWLCGSSGRCRRRHSSGPP
jgi:RNA polymerase sigma-70 factor, ECF subfamily